MNSRVAIHGWTFGLIHGQARTAGVVVVVVIM
jgi:hypothetical protein